MTDPTDDGPAAASASNKVDAGKRGSSDGAAGLDDLGYEQARDELVEVVRRLEDGGGSLEESLALWERGERLAAICQRRLDGARARLARAAGDDDGSTTGTGADGQPPAVG